MQAVMVGGGTHTQTRLTTKRLAYANATTIHTWGARLVVAIRADNGALALQTPIHLHRRADGCARSNAAAAKAKRGGEGGGVERGKCALPLAAARLLDWGLRHGCGADRPLAQYAMDLWCDDDDCGLSAGMT